MEFKLGDKITCSKYGEGKVVYVSQEINGGFDAIFEEYIRPFYANGDSMDDDYSVKHLEETFEFQVGDIVEFGGIEGVIVSLSNNSPYPLEVTLEGVEDPFEEFTLDGRMFTYHKKPLLNLVKRPVKKLELSADEITAAISRYKLIIGNKSLNAIMRDLGF